MRSGDLIYLGLTVALPIIVTELVLYRSARAFGDRKAYPWYSCALRVLAYSPCLIGANHRHGIMPMPVASAVFLSWQGGEGEIVWLYGIPEVFVGVCCYFVSFAIRANSSSEPTKEPTPPASNSMGNRGET